MKLKKITVQNFRGYEKSATLNIDDLTVLIGKNDAGKSTWLDALSIFFEEGSVKPDKKDLCIHSVEKSFSITASFIPPESMVIDATNPISLEDEYLLDENNLITIKKVYSGTATAPKIFIVAMHPEHEKLSDLLNKKLKDLKRLAKDLGIDEEQITGSKTKSATWREAIRSRVGSFETSLQEILISDSDTKEIWEPIKNELPVYGLFQVDRNNQDQDQEVQDPFKIAIKGILKRDDVIDAIQSLKDKIKTAYDDIANQTITELGKINPEIANQLHPDFGEPKIENAFKPEVNTDTGVPLNKRGSGVRRLVLLSFFKADILRRKQESDISNVIYAVEEPETSQHPEHQKMLIDSLLELSKEESAQVLFTTHSAQLVKELNYLSIRYINIIDGKPWITSGEGVLVAAKDELGEFPKVKSGYLFCVEGSTDEMFIRNIGELSVFKSIFDISDTSILPMNGGFIKKWVDNHYLENTDVSELHLYDRDVLGDYKTTADEVNNWDSCSALLTDFREIENYVHPNLINDFFSTDFVLNPDWGEKDIPQICSQKSGRSELEVKEIICGSLSKKMTEEMFEEMGTLDEVKGWFEELKKVS